MKNHFLKDHIWKNHVLRPLMVVIGIVIILVLVWVFYVPGDFGVHDQGYTYGWYREGNIEDWKAVTVKYQGEEYCTTCHQDKVDLIATTPHSIIQCENCHGPAQEHPSDPPKLAIDRTREQCLRCHSSLQYPSSARAEIRGIDPESHNVGTECATCHDPHNPTLGGPK
ncbi:MAG: cytochrome c3 family protein [bacterium]